MKDETEAPSAAVQESPLSDAVNVLDTQIQVPASKLLNSSKQGLIRFLHFRNIIGFLWLGPSLAILILNFRNHIIGAGLNCSNCRIDPYSTSQVQQIENLDGTNRDVLGALQFVAKGLEVWFMYVAGSFVYILAIHLSASYDQFPISLLLVYAEFMDLLYLKDLAMRARELAREKSASAASDPNAPDPTIQQPKSTHLVLYIFIFVVACLSVIANLMGVATATLVIPGLEWIDINQDDSTGFRGILSSQPPRDGVIARCRDSDLADGIYSCTENLYGATLDSMVEAAVSSDRQFEGRDGVILPPVYQEGNLSSSPNVSDTSPIVWVPNRQLLRAFSADLANYHLATTSDPGSEGGYPDSGRFNQSLQAQLQRTGPTLGLTGDCWVYDRPREFTISDDRRIRCYGGYYVNDTTASTKCIRWGSGWGFDSSSASFTIVDSVREQYNMSVTVYTTTEARYVFDLSCYSDGPCTWDQLFADPPDAFFRNISNSQQTYEYAMPQFSSDTEIWCDNTAYLSFATYALNPSPVSNLLSLAQLGVLHDAPGLDDDPNRATLSLHADWTLAAWSADASNGYVPGTRGSASRFIDAYQRFITTPQTDFRRFNLIHQYTVTQAVSLIPYDTSTLTTASDRRSQSQREDENPYTEATLTSWATVQLWKYGIGDSRTKTLGVVILIMGIVIVLAATVLWIEAPRSPTSMLVTALLHAVPAVPPEDKENGVPLRARYNRMSSQIVFSHPASPVAPSSGVLSPV